MKTHPFTTIRATGFKWLGLSTFSFLAACTGETVTSSSEANSNMSMAPSSVASVPASSSLAATSSVMQASSSSAVPVSEAFLRGQEIYNAQCAACHQDDGSGVTGVFPSVLVGDCSIAPNACREVTSLAGYVASAMPQPGKCTDLNGNSCATDVATYITQAFAPVVDQTDSDGDGITGANDLCPNTPKEELSSINHQGCTNITATKSTVFAINAGGEAYTAQDGTQFIADDAKYYEGSLGASMGAPSHKVANTEDDALYRKERWGKPLSYNIPLANGSYDVELHFAEVYFTEPSKRLMDINIEGQKVLAGYDIFAKAGGKNVAKVETLQNISITDSTLNIQFVGTTNNGSVVAIRVFGIANNDADNDGVIDSKEGKGCAGTAPSASVNAEGCSDAQRDPDGDGVLASADVCPNTPASEVASVDASGALAGCGITAKNADADADGIADVIDNCPNTLTGTRVGATGCAGNFSLPSGAVASPQMRLTELEYTNTVKKAFAVNSLPATTFLADNFGPFKIFTNNASDKTADFVTLVNSSHTLSASLAQQFAGQCNWNTNAKQCINQHLSNALAYLWREDSLSDADATAVAAVIQGAASRGATVEQALAAGIAFALIDDRAVYQMENGEDKTASGAQKLTAREFINRMSYLLVNTAPDQALIDDHTDIVHNDNKIAAHADRLMSDAAYKETVWQFFAEWLGMPMTTPESASIAPMPTQGDQCDSTPQCRAQFAGLAQSYDCQNSASNTSWCSCDGVRCDSLGGLSLEVSMHEETRRMVDHIIDNDLPISELFTADYSFINSTLAEHYGVPAPATDWARYDFPANANRLGILTHANFLTGNGKHGRDVNTIFRGKIVYERLFCEQMPPPPPPEQSVNLADEVADRGTHPACKGCHEVVDPIGRMFDLYDDYGKKFDKANLFGGLYMDVDIADHYDSVIEFAQALPHSRAFNHCASRQLFRFAMGRDVNESESQSFLNIRNALENTGSIKASMRALVTSDAFKNVYSEAAPQACNVGE